MTDLSTFTDEQRAAMLRTVDDFAAGLLTTLPRVPTGAEVLAAVRRFLEPTHTAFVPDGNGNRVRELLAGTGLRVRVIETPDVPDDTIYLINHAAFEEAGQEWPPLTQRQVIDRAVRRGGAVKAVVNEEAPWQN